MSKAAHAQRERERRARNIVAGFCARCPNLTDGAIHCASCRELERDRYHDRIKAGLCARCPGKRRSFATTCEKCGREQSQRVMRRLKNRK